MPRRKKEYHNEQCSGSDTPTLLESSHVVRLSFVRAKSVGRSFGTLVFRARICVLCFCVCHPSHTGGDRRKTNPRESYRKCTPARPLPRLEVLEWMPSRWVLTFRTQAQRCVRTGAITLASFRGQHRQERRACTLLCQALFARLFFASSKPKIPLPWWEDAVAAAFLPRCVGLTLPTCSLTVPWKPKCSRYPPTQPRKLA